MNQPQQPPAPPRRRRPQFHTVAVKSVDQLTPHMVRVTFAGEELAPFATHGPAEHLKVFFPQAGHQKPVLPTWNEDTGLVFDESVPRPISRTYTPRRWRPEALELDIEFVVHGEGVGSQWAMNVKPGDFATVTMPGGPYRLDEQAKSFLIAGDASAIPGIGTILEVLPPGSHADVYIEVEDSGEEQKLESPADISVNWLHCGPDVEASGMLLQKVIWDHKLAADSRVFVACEAGIMRNIRRHLINDKRLDRSAFHTHGYWKIGAANHPDHDLGDD